MNNDQQVRNEPPTITGPYILGLSGCTQLFGNIGQTVSAIVAPQMSINIAAGHGLNDETRG
jgi:hypothetical protein